jgi:hypothetical protein
MVGFMLPIKLLGSTPALAALSLRVLVRADTSVDPL